MAGRDERDDDDGDDDAGGGAEGARGGIRSLDAALVLLRAFRAFDGPATLSDLARAAGMPASRAHRYLASFLHAGLAVQTARSGRYDLGPAAAELGLAALARTDVVNRAADGLAALSEETGLTAMLSVWGSQGATVVRWERSPAFTVTALGLGSTLPLLNSATGRVFLAFLPRRLSAARLGAEMRAAADGGVSWPDLDPTPAAVDALAARVRAERAASVDGRFIPGLRAAAAPVTDWQDEAVAAVTLIGLGDEVADPGGRVRRALDAYARARSVPRA